jgi:hypothetical protein
MLFTSRFFTKKILQNKQENSYSQEQANSADAQEEGATQAEAAVT